MEDFYKAHLSDYEQYQCNDERLEIKAVFRHIFNVLKHHGNHHPQKSVLIYSPERKTDIGNRTVSTQYAAAAGHIVIAEHTHHGDRLCIASDNA